MTTIATNWHKKLSEKVINASQALVSPSWMASFIDNWEPSQPSRKMPSSWGSNRHHRRAVPTARMRSSAHNIAAS